MRAALALFVMRGYCSAMNGARIPGSRTPRLAVLWRRLRRAACVAALLPWIPASLHALNPDDYEESADTTALFQFNPADGVYGVAVGPGIWLKNTPVMANYFATLFRNGIEESWYGGAGMTLRLMPHWRVAPFIGGGGSYNQTLSTRSDDAGKNWPDQGESYWGGHVEGGVRIWLPWRYRLLEIMGRETWPSFSGGRDYWLIGIGMGAEL